jgi:hypothetical protein
LPLPAADDYATLPLRCDADIIAAIFAATPPLLRCALFSLAELSPHAVSPDFRRVTPPFYHRRR